MRIEVIDKSSNWYGFVDLSEDLVIKHPVTGALYDVRNRAELVLREHELTGVIFEDDGEMTLLFKKKGEQGVSIRPSNARPSAKPATLLDRIVSNARARRLGE
jgi:hypothetical protein